MVIPLRETGRQAVAAIVLLALPYLAGAATLPATDDPDLIANPMLEFLPAEPATDSVLVHDRRLKTLWLEALRSDDVRLRVRAADSIGRSYTQGFTELGECAPVLAELLGEADQPEAVRLAAADALGRLDARDQAPALLEANREAALEMVLLSDPLLARWQHSPAYPVWLGRLGESTSPAIRRSAIGALHQAQVTAAVEPLRQMVADARAPMSLRLAAARALADLSPQGLEPLAAPLVKADQPMVHRLLAVTLLSRHEGDAARQLLLQLVRDPEPAVRVPAGERLLAVAPRTLGPLAVDLAAHPHDRVRLVGAQALALNPSADHVAALGRLLSDPNPSIRRYSRDRLIELDGQADLRPAIRRLATEGLTHENWPARQQAALILGAVDEEAAAEDLLRLMREDPRHEVRLAAIVSLRRLALAQTRSALADRAQALHEATVEETRQYLQTQELLSKDTGAGGPQTQAQQQWQALKEGRGEAHARSVELAQIFMTLHHLGANSLEPLLRQYVARPWPSIPPQLPDIGHGAEARAAAIWVLGHLHADQPDAALVGELMQRAQDEGVLLPPPDTEDGEVRRQAFIALGRMKARQALPAFERYYDPDTHVAPAEVRWGLEQIQGQPLPPPQPQTLRMPARDFFLEPFSPR